VICVGCFYNLVCSGQSKVTISKADLQDKIKGGWQSGHWRYIRRTNGVPEPGHTGECLSTHPLVRCYIKETMTNNPGRRRPLHGPYVCRCTLRHSALMHPVAYHAKAYFNCQLHVVACQPGRSLQYFEWNSPSSVWSLAEQPAR